LHQVAQVVQVVVVQEYQMVLELTEPQTQVVAVVAIQETLHQAMAARDLLQFDMQILSLWQLQQPDRQLLQQLVDIAFTNGQQVGV
jgi:hypothetical protein